jgi:hypothetical protein
MIPRSHDDDRAAITLALFAPLPLAHSLGAAVIAHVSYRTIYLAAALVLCTTAIWLYRRFRSEWPRHSAESS